MTHITIRRPDGGEFSAYLALPESSAPAPGILILQHIFGVNGEIRDAADQLAREGYIVACPDLYWRAGHGIELTPGSDSERAFALVKAFDYDAAIQDLEASALALAGHQRCNGRIGSVGFCLGGALAYLLATTDCLLCNVGYYPVEVETMLDRAPLRAPLLLHLPVNDRHLDAAGRAAIIARIGDQSEIHQYVAGHAFTRVGGPFHDAEATLLAGQRTLSFLSRYLQANGAIGQGNAS